MTCIRNPSLLIGFLFFSFARGVLSLAQTSAPDVSLNGSLSTHSVRNDEVVQFTISIRNKMDATAAEVEGLFREILTNDGRFTKRNIDRYIAGQEGKDGRMNPTVSSSRES